MRQRMKRRKILIKMQWRLFFFPPEKNVYRSGEEPSCCGLNIKFAFVPWHVFFPLPAMSKLFPLQDMGTRWIFLWSPSKNNNPLLLAVVTQQSEHHREYIIKLRIVPFFPSSHQRWCSWGSGSWSYKALHLHYHPMLNIHGLCSI